MDSDQGEFEAGKRRIAAAAALLRDPIRALLDAELALHPDDGTAALCLPTEAVREICIEWAREHGLTRL